MLSDTGLGFQGPDAGMSARLAEILKSREPGLIVAIPGVISWSYAQWWETIYPSAAALLDPSVKYGDSLVSRGAGVAAVSLADFRRIWDGRRVVFVYSSRGRFHEDPRLFSGIAGREFVDIPPRDAFAAYDSILAKCMELPRDRIFIIAAGPTATILAYDLCRAGYQALDLGHLPNEYACIEDDALRTEKLPIEKA
jgi:hypothetical protein